MAPRPSRCGPTTPATRPNSARSMQIVSDYNASQAKYKVEVQAFPQDSYNHVGDRRGVLQNACRAFWTSTARTCRTGRGPGISPRWTGLDETLSKFLPSTVGTYNGQDLLRRLLRRRAGDVRAQVGARAEQHPHPDHRSAVDRRGIQRRAGHPEGDRPVDEPAGHGDRRHRRVVALRLLAVPAELRRRPDRPRPTTRAPTACSTAPRRWQWATWFRGLVDQGYIAAKSGARRGRRLPQRQERRSSGTASWGADAARAKLGDDMRSCRRRTSATARRSAAGPGSGASSADLQATPRAPWTT